MMVEDKATANGHVWCQLISLAARSGDSEQAQMYHDHMIARWGCRQATVSWHGQCHHTLPAVDSASLLFACMGGHAAEALFVYYAALLPCTATMYGCPASQLPSS
jgi:hypothetical protein